MNLDLLSKAYDRRRPFMEEGTNAFRLFSGTAEGISGLIVERYDAVVILQIHEGKWTLSREALEAIGKWYLALQGVESVYVKQFVSDRSHSTAGESLQSSVPFLGKVAPVQFPVLENGLKLLIKPYDGFSTGLFLDQRNNRQFLRSQSAGKSVLNCFAYTCAFSVYCADGGGKVTSVDLSKKYLEWGKLNFVANRLNLDGHRFFETDVFRFFKAAQKRAEVYDLVIVDPPSFSRNHQGEVFSLKRDLGQLLKEAETVVAPGGKIFVSANYSQWDISYLRKATSVAWGHRTPSFLDTAKLPGDYESGPDPICYILAKLN